MQNIFRLMSRAGSCWAFSTVVVVEGINQIKTNKLVTLSEQELVHYDKEENQGYNGGLMESAFEFIKQKGGITTESNYPYTAQEGTCDKSKVQVCDESLFSSISLAFVYPLDS